MKYQYAVQRNIRAACLAALCLFILMPLGRSADDNGDFYFVQFTDTHFDGGRHNRRAEAVVDAVNRLPFEVEFVVVTGDIMADNIEKSAIAESGIEILSRLEAPVYLLPGNHDIRLKKLESTHLDYTGIFGPVSYSAEHKGVLLLFFYSEPLRNSFELPGYRPFEWIRGELDKSKGAPSIIFHHAPTCLDFYNNSYQENWPRAVVDEWNRTVNSYNVKAIIAGHFHRDELHWNGDVPLFVASSVASYWGRQASFRIYIYHAAKGRLEYYTQYIEDPPDPK